MVPVVMIVEGVLNGALVPASEFSRYVEAWNGQPVPVLHPEREGSPVSANSPDIIERNTIGRLFNCYAENGKLKGEAWINVNKAQRLGHNELLTALEAGEVVEVSTGYFADGEPKAGEYNGEQYQEIHRNIRPDHLALLPGEIGACSVADGCGTRVNQSKGFVMQTKEALSTIAQALGLRSNCECNDDETKEAEMPEIMKQAEQLRKNEKLTPEHLEMLQGMDPEQLRMVEAIADALKGEAPEEPESPEEPEGEAMEYDDKEQMQRMSEQDFEKMVANRVDQAVRRRDVMAKLATNEACPFDESEMKAMSVEHLEKLEKSIRPADYSGAAGFATNSGALDTNVEPLVPRGALQRKKKEA